MKIYFIIIAVATFHGYNISRQNYKWWLPKTQKLLFFDTNNTKPKTFSSQIYNYWTTMSTQMFLNPCLITHKHNY